MIIPVIKNSGRCGVWAVLKSWLSGRQQLAREREDRATAELILRELPAGSLWLDRDGERIRLIARAPVSEARTMPQMEEVAAFLEAGQVSLHAGHGGER